MGINHRKNAVIFNLYLNLVKLFILIIFAFLFSFPPEKKVHASYKSTRNLSVTALVPFKYYVNIYGYTSPKSLVQAQGINIWGETYSLPSGFFRIDYLPISFEAEEVCLYTIDSERRLSFPVCIPLPQNFDITDIGPIILPPTLSVSSSFIYEKDRAFAYGRTLPDSVVKLSLFENTSGANNDLSFVQSVSAFSLPEIEFRSDINGNFSFSLPTQKQQSYRVFTKTSYTGSPSPISNIISVKVEPLYKNLIRKYWRLVLILLILGALTASFYIFEKRTGLFRRKLKEFIQKKLKPRMVKLHLGLARSKSSLKPTLKSNRKSHAPNHR